MLVRSGTWRDVLEMRNVEFQVVPVRHKLGDVGWVILLSGPQLLVQVLGALLVYTRYVLIVTAELLDECNGLGLGEVKYCLLEGSCSTHAGLGILHYFQHNMILAG